MYAELIERLKDREKRKNTRAARMPHLFANFHRDRKSRPFPYSISDFMPQEEKEPQTPEQHLAIIQAINAQLGGEVIE